MDGLDPTHEYRSRLKDVIYAGDPTNPVHRGSHTLWVVYPHPAQPSGNPTPASFVTLEEAVGPRPLRGIGDMRGIPATIEADVLSDALIVAFHESSHRWLVPDDLELTLPGGRVRVLSSEALTTAIFHDRPFPAPALLGRENQHWGVYFQGDGSFMDGVGWDVAADVDGLTRWTQRQPQIPVTPAGLAPITVGGQYCDLDLFIMGLRGAADCYPSTGGLLSWLFPKLSVGEPMQYLAGLFIALGDDKFAYFGFVNDHRVLGATYPAGPWSSGQVPIGGDFDALGGASMMLRIVYDGAQLLFQAARADRPGGPGMFDDVANAATVAYGGDFRAWQTIGALPVRSAPVAFGLITKTSNPVLCEAQFNSFETYEYTVAAPGPESFPLDGLPHFDGGPLSSLSPHTLFSHVPLGDGTIEQIRQWGGKLLISVPWQQTYDHSPGVDQAPKVIMLAPDGPVAVGTTASMFRTAIGPAAAGGARGTTMWGTQSTAPVAGVVVPPRLEAARHDPLPWRVAFIVAAADAASVTDEELGRLDTLRRYYQAAAPAVSQGTLTVWTELDWQGWQPVLGGTFNQGTVVSALSTRPGWIDLFAVGQDGPVYTAWFRPDQGWQGWQPVAGRHFNQGTVVSAVSTRPGLIDLFAVGQDGPVYTAWFRPDQGWQGWQPVLGGTFNQGTVVSAVSTRPGWIDLFAVGQDGPVYTAWFRPDQGWQGWQPVAGRHFNQGTVVSAVSTRPGLIDLFAVGQDGPVYTAWFRPDQGWQGWQPVLGGTFNQGTVVSAVSTRPGWIDLFAVGQDDPVYTAWFRPDQGWQGWQPVLGGTFNQGTVVSAVSTRPGWIDLFAVGQDDPVYTAWFRPDQGWQGWQPVLGGTFNQGTVVTAVSTRPVQMDLFAVADDGRVNTAWYIPNS